MENSKNDSWLPLHASAIYILFFQPRECEMLNIAFMLSYCSADFHTSDFHRLLKEWKHSENHSTEAE